ncbi:hypothetical protein [Brevibacillus brevis]|uniref:hypothetical protein n=1 Tax=Brevibacillus brevis TaxID=1393 RepID=UPI001C8D5050|nr:hypothetical protein [Brevibacillus brevis]MBY0088422.1 hypothetical protein [Brevibacillus brevis]
MDLKTLEYMEQRAKQGRELAERILELKSRISRVKGNSLHCIDFKIGSGTLRTSQWDDKQISEYQAHIEASMINVYIDITNAEIQRLEKELFEL